MELVEIELGYDYQVRGRRAGMRNECWLTLKGAAQAVIPSVSAAEAPQAAVLALPSGYRERYRAFDGRLYRRVGVPSDPARPSAEPLMLDAAMRAGPLRIGNVARLPWRWIERGSENVYDGPDARRTRGELVPDVIENRSDRALARLAVRSREGILAVDGVLHVASEPPMIEVHAHGGTVNLRSGVELERSDPEFERHGDNHTTLFALDRLDDAVAFAADLAVHWADGRADPAEVRARAVEQMRAWLPRFGGVEIEPGYGHLLLADELIAGARRNISFLCWAFATNVPDMEPRGIAAFSAMREAVAALDTPEGRTRANARAAFEALTTIAAAGPAGWSGESSERASLASVRDYAHHLVARYRTDPRFTPGQDEIMAPEDDAAMRGLDAAI